MSTDSPVRADLLIIGGGPAGAACALEARRRGVDRVVLLEKAASGRLKSCAGGISPRGLRSFEALDALAALQDDACSVTAAKLVFGTGNMVLSGDETSTVKHRALLDASMLALAGDAGAEIRYRTAATGALEKNGRCVGVTTEEGPVYAGLTVFAAGAGSSLLRDDRPRKVLTSCTAWYEALRFKTGQMEMVFPPEISPHYMWLFPESDTRANIGMCLFPDRLQGRKVFDLFDELAARYFGDRLAEARVFAGPLVHPIRSVRRFANFAPPGSMVCGEQAGLVSAYTGEGISVALESGRAAGRTAADILTAGHLPPAGEGRRIGAYEQEIRRRTRAFLAAGYRLCRFGPVLLKAASLAASSSRMQSLITRMMTK